MYWKVRDARGTWNILTIVLMSMQPNEEATWSRRRSTSINDPNITFYDSSHSEALNRDHEGLQQFDRSLPHWIEEASQRPGTITAPFSTTLEGYDGGLSVRQIDILDPHLVAASSTRESR